MLQPPILAVAGWFLQLLVGGGLVALAAWLGRRRAEFAPWEAMIFFVPFLAWLGLSAAQQTYPKGPGNLVLEPCLLGVAIGLAGAIRVSLANRYRQEKLGFVLFLAVLAAALLIVQRTPAI